MNEMPAIVWCAIAAAMDAWPEGETIPARQLRIGRAAIAAMEIPTQKMVQAAETDHGLLEGLCYEQGWRTMAKEARR
jgi:hypothetical protein